MKVYFPYEKVRQEQQELVKDVADAVSKEKIFLAHAPTGLGKTVSSLAPALSYAIENGKKVFFLTPKISQHEIVLETANLMNEKFQLNIKAVDLVGRKQMCVDPFISRVGVGFYEACAKKKKDKTCNYYNNTKGFSPKQKAIAMRKKRDLLQDYNNSYLHVKEQCQFRGLCPYEITLEMIKRANLVIGDYSHLFHPEIREGILGPSELTLGDIVLIVDEAHNVPERIRDMMTSSLDLNTIEKAQKEAKNVGDFEVEFLLKDIEKDVLGLGKKLSLEKNEAVLEGNDLLFLKRVGANDRERISDASTKFMNKNKTENCYLLAIEEFLYDASKEKEHTIFVIERKGSLTVTIQPLDPADMTSNVLSQVHSAVLMSGTLLPLTMFSDIFGVTQLNSKFSKNEINGAGIKNNSIDATTALLIHQKELAGQNLDELKVITKEYQSPFPKENRLNLISTKTTTKFTSRSSTQYADIALEIDKVVSKVPGNTIVFFPSFDLMYSISNLLKTRRQVLKQEREMSQDEKTKLVSEFKTLGSRFGGVLLAVSGGSFAEGLDFPGDYLSCAIIVGVPFAKMNIYSNALINYCEKKFKKGWDYAINAPAINKAMQAAGRVIRTETDRGVCVFLDTRFGEDRYKRFYPKGFEAKHTTEPQIEVEEFFKKHS